MDVAKVQIDKLISPIPSPPSEDEVLIPLHKAQIVEAARLEAAKLELAREVQLAQATAEAAAEDQKRIVIAVNVTPQTPAGNHTDWMAQAGISPTNYGYAEYIISRESGWNPNAVNRNGGACGLGQQLPCGKWAHTWNDPVGALIDVQNYVNQRYGGWYGAYVYWTNHQNY